MPINIPQPSPLIISYLGLRKAVGFIGLGLPFVLVFGGKAFPDAPWFQYSISDYYYTGMRNVFVGSLCSIGVFLITYRGYDIRDRIAGALAAVFAIGVALFPTTPEVMTEAHMSITAAQTIFDRIHLASAALLFSTLAYFSLALFTKSDPVQPMTMQKKKRNGVYIVCGVLILACIVLIALSEWLFLNSYSPFENPNIKELHPVFWLESAAVIAFGTSWLTKGEAILADQR